MSMLWSNFPHLTIFPSELMQGDSSPKEGIGGQECHGNRWTMLMQMLLENRAGYKIQKKWRKVVRELLVQRCGLGRDRRLSSVGRVGNLEGR